MLTLLNLEKSQRRNFAVVQALKLWYLHNSSHLIRFYVRQMHATIQRSTRLRLHRLIFYHVHLFYFSIYVAKWTCFGSSTSFAPQVSGGCLCDCTLGHEVQELSRWLPGEFIRLAIRFLRPGGALLTSLQANNKLSALQTFRALFWDMNIDWQGFPSGLLGYEALRGGSRWLSRVILDIIVGTIGKPLTKTVRY